AIQHFKNALLEQDRLHHRATAMLCTLLTVMGRTTEARDYLTVADLVFPKDPSLKVLHALNEALEGHPQTAAHWLRKAPPLQAAAPRAAPAPPAGGGGPAAAGPGPGGLRGEPPPDQGGIEGAGLGKWVPFGGCLPPAPGGAPDLAPRPPSPGLPRPAGPVRSL